jgi:hypothetical protein
MTVLPGQVYERWTVLEQAPDRFNRPQWLCQCACGTTRPVAATALINGYSKSCGCLRLDRKRKACTTHGQHSSSEYSSYFNMRQRCENPKNKDYPVYGGCGIVVCPEWQTFERFLTDMGPKPTPQHTIERKDNSKGYSPDNCRWATRIEQLSNTRRNRYIEFEGQRYTISEWARRKGLRRHLLRWRLDHNWTIADALNTPVS